MLALLRYRHILLFWLFLSFSSAGKILWSREEALASILSVEMVDLPVSQIMAKMEDEFGSRGTSLLSNASLVLQVYANYYLATSVIS